MLHALNQNYLKFLKKLPLEAWKTALYLILIVSWSIILIGTYLLLKQ